MLKRDDIHRYLLGALEKKVPDKSKLVDILIETLFMEKGAVYRRLRGEVPFSFFEVVNIAEKLEVSLNSLVYAGSERINRFELNFIEYANMNEVDYKHWEDYISFISASKNDPQSCLAESSNFLPFSIYAKYDFISKYFLFKCQYLLHGLESRVSFGNFVVPERLQKIHQTYFIESKKFAKTTYIWNKMIFLFLVTDIQFFTDINLISGNDRQLIKDDLFALLDYIEDITLTGYFEETQKPVSFYISDVNIDADYCCLQLNNRYLSLVRTFILNTVGSTEKSSFKKMENWIESLKKSSTLITQSAAAYRADFFEKQRKLISDL